MKIKILKMFCRGNHAATIVSCLSYYSLAYKLRCPCNQIRDLIFKYHLFLTMIGFKSFNRFPDEVFALRGDRICHAM